MSVNISSHAKYVCYCSRCLEKPQKAAAIYHHIGQDQSLAQSPDLPPASQQIYQEIADANSAQLHIQLARGQTSLQSVDTPNPDYHDSSPPGEPSMPNTQFVQECGAEMERGESLILSSVTAAHLTSYDFATQILAAPHPQTLQSHTPLRTLPKMSPCSTPPQLNPPQPSQLHPSIEVATPLPTLFPDAEPNEIYESVVDNLFTLPLSQAQLQSELLGDYKRPPHPPSQQQRAFDQGNLDDVQQWSLKLYITWKRSRGTVVAFDNHKALLEQALGFQLLSLYMVRNLSRHITGVHPRYIPVCPNNCIAYTGQFEHLTVCPGKRRVKDTSQKKVRTLNVPCRLPKMRSASGNIPQAQMLVVPVLAKIKAMFANEAYSKHLRYRDRLMRQTMELLAKGAEIRYQDFGNGKVQEELRKRGFTFTGSPDSEDFELAFAFTSDGVQLTMKKESDTWVLMIIILDLPPSLRYRVENTIVVCVTPGPYPPGNLESFLYPLLQEMAVLGEGVWVWDALRNAYFVLRAFIVLALADQMGSAKLNGLVGHIGRVGDRYSEMIAARATEDGKYLYYPLFSDIYVAVFNPNRPKYDARKLPLRTEEKYWSTIDELAASSSNHRAALVTQSGVSRLPLLAASKAFTFPSLFFPSDPFHLLYENCAAWLWDLMLDSGYLTREQGAEFGRLLFHANATLPPSFSGPVRNLYTKRNSQYKIYEWMNVVHLYTVPILRAINADSRIIHNYALFVEIAEEVTHLRGHTESELQALEDKIIKFIKSYELLYVNDAADITRCRLCITYLIHIPRQIRWNGSFRIGSQATCELTIGHLGKKIRSAKAPFANLANILVEDEIIACLDLRMPHLHPRLPAPSEASRPRLLRNFPILRSTLDSPAFKLDLSIIQAANIWPGWDGKFTSALHRWGKYKTKLPRTTLTTLLSESSSRVGANMKHRSSRYFEATTKDGNIWGEARAIYQLDGQQSAVLVYNALGSVRLFLRVCHVAKMAGSVSVVPIDSIQAVVGVFGFEDDITILRKHAALSMLQVADRGLPVPSSGNEEYENDTDTIQGIEGENVEAEASDDEYYDVSDIERN
ncbi:hypothetical protein ONZ45_g14488 [Pleurotus djamor]|nr:hypothetical protein ONZ45_g14488 [Pleurotus djamor]